MALVVLGKEETPLPVVGGGIGLELFLQQRLLKQLLPEPQRNGLGEGGESARGESQICLQKALELEERLVIENDVVYLSEAASALSKAILDRMAREARVVLLPRKAFLLGGRHDASVLHERCRAVVIESRDAQDAHATRRLRTACRRKA